MSDALYLAMRVLQVVLVVFGLLLLWSAGRLWWFRRRQRRQGW